MNATLIDAPPRFHIPTAAEWHEYARRMGSEDAARGAFAPEAHFADVDDSAEYTFAFLKVRPNCEPARAWWQSYTHQGVDYPEPDVQ